MCYLKLFKASKYGSSGKQNVWLSLHNKFPYRLQCADITEVPEFVQLFDNPKVIFTPSPCAICTDCRAALSCLSKKAQEVSQTGPGIGFSFKDELLFAKKGMSSVI